MEEMVDLVSFLFVCAGVQYSCFLCFICLRPPDLHFVKVCDFQPHVSSEMPFLNAALGSCLELTHCCWRHPKLKALCYPEASSVTQIEASLCFHLSYAVKRATTVPLIVLDHVTTPSCVLTPPYWASQEHLAVWESCQTAEKGRMKWWDRGRRDRNNKGGGGGAGPFFLVIFANFHVTFTLSHFYLPLPLPVSLPGRLSHISSAFTPLLLLSPFPQSSADS